MKKKIIFILSIVSIIFILLNNFSNVQAYEYNDGSTRETIRDYNVEIKVNKDASMEVTENIEVYANGREIEHGIYRDFPTQYKNKKVKFEVQEVLQDDEDIEYKISSVDRGARIKIGDANKTVSKGLHTYTIKYMTERQLGFEEDYDELYWNVIGAGWLFNIEHCYAKVTFPKESKILRDDIQTYTGKYGKTGQTVEVYTNVISDNIVEFEINNTLIPNEAFTISTKIEKGAIDKPSFSQEVSWFIEDNIISVVISIGLIFLIIWQYFSWKKYGIDPKPNVIIPKYFPPEGLQPADVKYIGSMGSMTKVVEATIINLAVKGYFKFTKKSEKSKTIIIEKNKQIDNLPELDENEKTIYEKFSDKQYLEYSSSFQRKLENIKNSVSQDLNEKYTNKLFFKNYGEFAKSIFATIGIIIIAIVIGFCINQFAAEQYLAKMILVLPVALFLIIPIILIISLIKAQGQTIIKIIIISIIGVPSIMGILMMGLATGAPIFEFSMSTWVVIATALDNFVFFKLIRRYTEEGLRTKEDIEGFKMFINTAKDDDFKDKTPEMFDKYFPYAYVLGLENKWAAKFEDVLQAANYSPTWCSSYMYHDGLFDAVVFTHAFSSSFSSGMSTASTAPSSSTGSSGGGGFSGGGGGGRRPEADGRKTVINILENYLIIMLYRYLISIKYDYFLYSRKIL